MEKIKPVSGPVSLSTIPAVSLPAPSPLLIPPMMSAGTPAATSAPTPASAVFVPIAPLVGVVMSATVFIVVVVGSAGRVFAAFHVVVFFLGAGFDDGVEIFLERRDARLQLVVFL